MDRDKGYRVCTFISLLLSYFFHTAECFEIRVRHGEPVEFDLPEVKACGQYSLLDPFLRPVLIVEGSNVPSLIEPYNKRGTLLETSQGFKLTLSRATDTDAGEYKVAPSSMKVSPPCVTESFYVTVIETTDEHFEPWGEWSFCISQCSPHRRRSRSRRCSATGGCGEMGPSYQTETCDKADHCPNWSSWGGWGACSAKCGKGFKIRQRVCLSGNSSLVKSSECRGVSTQSHMCLTVCEVVGTWTDWSEWSNCSVPCGSDVTQIGTRTRSRTCSTDGQRLVTQSCLGNRTEEEQCSSDCTTAPEVTESTAGTTDAVFVGVPEAAAEGNINVISVIAGSTCAFVVIVVLIIVIVLKNRVHRRRESVPTLRPADAASNRRKKVSKERKSSAPQNNSGNGSGNVYSEFNSNANANSFWPSSEFDSTYALDNEGFRRPSAVNVLETIKDEDCYGEFSDGFDSEFDDIQEATGGPPVCERKEIIYEKSRASYQRTHVGDDKVRYSDGRSVESEDFVVTENECYEPPELWSNDNVRDSFVFDSLPPLESDQDRNINKPHKEKESESVYYEPPVEDEIDEASKRAEMKRQESEMTDDSVYENCEINRGTMVSLMSMHEHHRSIDGDCNDYYEIPESRLSAEVKANTDTRKSDIGEKTIDDHENSMPGLTTVNMRNGSIVTIDERFPHLSKEDLDSEHIYVNGNAVNEIKDFYVTPKYHYGLGKQVNDPTENEHIYDTPRFNH